MANHVLTSAILHSVRAGHVDQVVIESCSSATTLLAPEVEKWLNAVLKRAGTSSESLSIRVLRDSGHIAPQLLFTTSEKDVKGRIGSLQDQYRFPIF